MSDLVPQEAIDAAISAWRSTPATMPITSAITNAIEGAAPHIAAKAIRDAVDGTPKCLRWGCECDINILEKADELGVGGE